MPRIVPDRDKTRNWYLDEDYSCSLPGGHRVYIRKGYRFNGHSVPLVFRLGFTRYDEQDIVAALVHDYLIDTMPWHRFPRKYIDDVYCLIMYQVSYGRRKHLMPLAVYLWGYIKTLGWRDYRGEVKPGTLIDVRVDMI